MGPQGLNVLTPLLPNSSTTTYFRTLVDVRFESGWDFTLRHVVDDGAVFYVNGTEVGRFNMPPGVIIHSTVAPEIVPEGVIRSMPVRLLAGTNVIAVELHQKFTPANDVLFGAQLIGIVPGLTAPRLRITRDRQTGALTLSWFGRAILEQADAFPAQWTLAPDQSNPQTLLPGQAARFYRLRQ